VQPETHADTEGTDDIYKTRLPGRGRHRSARRAVRIPTAHSLLKESGSWWISAAISGCCGACRDMCPNRGHWRQRYAGDRDANEDGWIRITTGLRLPGGSVRRTSAVGRFIENHGPDAGTRATRQCANWLLCREIPVRSQRVLDWARVRARP
jgi:hypothetical protein